MTWQFQSFKIKLKFQCQITTAKPKTTTTTTTTTTSQAKISNPNSSFKSKLKLQNQWNTWDDWIKRMELVNVHHWPLITQIIQLVSWVVAILLNHGNGCFVYLIMK